MANITITVYSDESEDEMDGMSFQYYDIPIIPRVGETFYMVSSRDEEGNYDPLGNPLRRFHGEVSRVEYSIEERGTNSQTNRRTLYVGIYLRNCEKWIKDA